MQRSQRDTWSPARSRASRHSQLQGVGARRRVIGATAVVLAVLVLTGLHLSGATITLHRSSHGYPVSAHGRDYFVSPRGEDAFDGSSPDRAWKTLRNAARVTFHPGDRLLLAGGSRYQGTIRFDAADAGDPADPVLVGSYGGGRATIAPTAGAGITIYDTAGVEIHDVTLAGNPRTYPTASGIQLFNDLPRGHGLDHVTVTGVDVSGFKDGIALGAGAGGSGFRDVTVSDARLHGNRDSGLFSYGPSVNPAAAVYAHQRVTVDRVEAYDNAGDPSDPVHDTGNGIVLGSVAEGVVRNSVAHDNGVKCSAHSGPVGIFAYDSTRVTIEHNVAYHNRTGGGNDGGGFDLDENVTSSYVQYNLSYDNDGPGYLVYSKPGQVRHTGNVVRFNISHDDARKFDYYGGIVVGGSTDNVQVYQNTVLIHSSGPAHPPAMVLWGSLRRVAVRNNIFVAVDTVLISAAIPDASQLLFRGNDLYSASGPWQATWGDTTYASLAAWRAASGQEAADGHDTALSVDPHFADPRAQSAGGAARAAGFVPRVDSPLAGAGVDLRAAGVDPGAVDYFGRPLSGRVTVGAAQAVAR